MSIPIYIRASSLAKMTGHNKYVTEEEAFEDFLAGNPILATLLGYQLIEAPKTHVEAKLLTLDEKINSLIKELNKDLLPSVKSKPLDEKIKILLI